jgi:transposase
MAKAPRHPLHQLIATQLRSSSYLRVDETPIRYLEPGSGKAQKGYLWTYHSAEHGALYDWHTGRSNTCLDNILIDPEGKASFEGFLQSDGFAGYQAFLERHKDKKLKIIPISCLAHIRRKFFGALGDHPKIAAWILYQISEIYHLESRLTRRRAGPKLRKRARKLLLTRTYHHLENLFAHLQKNRRTILPKSALGKALKYACDQWSKLLPCLEEEQIAWDNNRVENDIRPTKLGMKNWLFIGRAETGWQTAVIYTLVEQIRSQGKDPAAYLTWLFEKLIHEPPEEDFPALLPKSWLARQKAKSEKQAA